MTGSAEHGAASTKGGQAHWWAQRITAVALVPLSLWFVVAIIGHVGTDHGAVTAWLASPAVAILMVLTLVAAFYHAMLGLEVVVDDYVHGPGPRRAALVCVRFACVLLGAAGVFAVLSIAVSA